MASIRLESSLRLQDSDTSHRPLPLSKCTHTPTTRPVAVLGTPELVLSPAAGGGVGLVRVKPRSRAELWSCVRDRHVRVDMNGWDALLISPEVAVFEPRSN